MIPYVVEPWCGVNMAPWEIDQVGAVRVQQLDDLEAMGVRGIRCNYPPIVRNLTTGTDKNISSTEYWATGNTWPYNWDDSTNAGGTYAPASGTYYGSGQPYHSHSVTLATEVLARGWRYMVTLCDRNVGLERMFTAAQQAIALWHCAQIPDDARRFMMSCAIGSATNVHSTAKAFLLADAEWLMSQYPNHPNMVFQAQNGSEMEESSAVGFRWCLDGSVTANYPVLVANGSGTTTTTAYPAANQATLTSVAGVSVGSVIYFGTAAMAARITGIAANTVTLDRNLAGTVIGETVTQGMASNVNTATWKSKCEEFYDTLYASMLTIRPGARFLRKSRHAYSLVGGNNISGPVSSRVDTELMVSADATIVGTRGEELWDWFKGEWDLGVREFWFHCPWSASKDALWLRKDGSCATLVGPDTALISQARNAQSTVATGATAAVQAITSVHADWAINDWAYFIESKLRRQVTGVAAGTPGTLTFGAAITTRTGEAVARCLADDEVQWFAVVPYEQDVREAFRRCANYINSAGKGEAKVAYW